MFARTESIDKNYTITEINGNISVEKPYFHGSLWLHSQFRTFEAVQKSQYYGVGCVNGLLIMFPH